MTQEEALIRAFAAPQRSPRYLALLESPRGRSKLLAALAHDFQLDTRYARHISGADAAALAIERTLRELGAPDTCYCVSENPDLDARTLPLREAVTATVGYGMGTLISCIPGVLGYYEAEDRNARYLLHHAAA